MIPHGTPDARCSARWQRRARSAVEPSNPSARATATSSAALDDSPAPIGQRGADRAGEARRRPQLGHHAGDVAGPRRARPLAGRRRRARRRRPRLVRRYRGAPTRSARRSPRRWCRGRWPSAGRGRRCSRCDRRSGSPVRARRLDGGSPGWPHDRSRARSRAAASPGPTGLKKTPLPSSPAATNRGVPGARRSGATWSVEVGRRPGATVGRALVDTTSCTASGASKSRSSRPSTSTQHGGEAVAVGAVECRQVGHVVATGASTSSS